MLLNLDRDRSQVTATIDSRGVVIIDTPHVLEFNEGVVQVGVIRRFLTEAVVTPTQPRKTGYDSGLLRPVAPNRLARRVSTASEIIAEPRRAPDTKPPGTTPSSVDSWGLALVSPNNGCTHSGDRPGPNHGPHLSHTDLRPPTSSDTE